MKSHLAAAAMILALGAAPAFAQTTIPGTGADTQTSTQGGTTPGTTQGTAPGNSSGTSTGTSSGTGAASGTSTGGSGTSDLPPTSSSTRTPNANEPSGRKGATGQ